MPIPPAFYVNSKKLHPVSLLPTYTQQSSPFESMLFYNCTNFCYICPRNILSHYSSILCIRKTSRLPLSIPYHQHQHFPQLSPPPALPHEKSPAGTKPTGLLMLIPFHLIASGNEEHISLETNWKYYIIKISLPHKDNFPHILFLEQYPLLHHSM